MLQWQISYSAKMASRLEKTPARLMNAYNKYTTELSSNEILIFYLNWLACNISKSSLQRNIDFFQGLSSPPWKIYFWVATQSFQPNHEP